MRAGYAYPNLQVPTHQPEKIAPYLNRREPHQIAWLVVHHTGNDVNARPSLEDVANYQIGPTAQAPFPGFAYTGYIDDGGRFYLVWDIETVTWSQGDNSPYSIDGVGIYNYEGLAICFSGRDPTPQQEATYKRVKLAFETVLGRAIPVKGHREVCGPGDTECPGDAGIAMVARLNKA